MIAVAIFRRPETPAQDEARTGRLLDALDRAPAGALPGDDVLTQFEDVVLEGLACGPACSGAPYPPTGHDYPRKGR